MTISLILAIIAMALTAVSATGHCPLWAPVFVLSLLELVQALGVK